MAALQKELIKEDLAQEKAWPEPAGHKILPSGSAKRSEKRSRQANEDLAEEKV